MKSAITLIAAIALAAMLCAPSYAREISGEGRGGTRSEAQASALADLSKAIQVEVKSDFTSHSKATGTSLYQDVDEAVTVTSNLPILGAVYSDIPVRDGFAVRASIDSDRTLALYAGRLNDIVSEMKAAIKAASASKSNAAYEAYARLLGLCEDYARHKAVALMLGAESLPDAPVREAEVRAGMASMEQAVDSIDLAAKLISRDMKGQSVYVYPPRAGASHEVTPFAGAVRDRVAAEVGGAASPKGAKYLLEGSYETRGEGIDLVYRMTDVSGATHKTAIVRLAPAAYAGYETRPKSAGFDSLLYSGVVVSSALRVDMATNMGSESLLFRQGETMELLVKATQSVYYYIVGHVTKDEWKVSYLLELQDTTGPRRFVKFINADDANKWISIGSFEVTPPFGVESLQLIASTRDLAESLPQTTLNRDGLYVVSGSPEEGVVKTRALKPVAQKIDLSAEAVLMYTTMKKTGR